MTQREGIENMSSTRAWSAGCMNSVAAFLLGLFIHSSAIAQDLGTIFTDDWWDPNESGWGLVVAHQQNFMFTTFFIYRADGSSYWVTGQLQKVGTSGLGAFPVVFSGPVYETHGSGFAQPWNPAAFGIQQVGTATFSASTFVTATLQYSINGTNVTKQLQRQTLSTVNYSSTYAGGSLWTLSQCVPAASAGNGVTQSNSGTLTIVQSGSSFQATAVGPNSCSFNGAYTQQGSLGHVDGTFSCGTGEVGTFTMFGMQWTLFGMSAGITGRSQFCTFTGVVGGMTGMHIQ